MDQEKLEINVSGQSGENDEKNISKSDPPLAKIEYAIIFLLVALLLTALYNILGTQVEVHEYKYGSVPKPFDKNILKCRSDEVLKVDNGRRI